jgi:vitamin B12 transporter
MQPPSSPHPQHHCRDDESSLEPLAWRSRRRSFAIATALVVTFAYRIPEAIAQTPPTATAESSTLVPPELLEKAEAEYPAQARDAHEEATVVLRLDIDVDGHVTKSDVRDPVGRGFDEAARAASLRLRFSPARRGGRPVPARILYRYEFRLPEAPPAPAPAPPLPASTASSAPAQPEVNPSADVKPGADAKAAADPKAAADIKPIEVTVRGATEAERLRGSALAIHVIETKHAQRETADLGEVLARSEGVSVQRGGGLGSSMRFSLNGLTDDQVRFFLDGVPLELSGFPWGIANVPVNLVQRVEVYRGVVPSRFGADALGGAVNLVTNPDVRGTHGAVSYQAGSFGTNRATFGLHTYDEPTGLFSRVSAFFDHADNDYPIDVEAPDSVGRLAPARVYRFHDAYTAGGVNVETGVIKRKWAKRLLVRAFVADYSKELPHNPVMTVPYGDVTFDRMTAGASVHYEHVLARKFPVDVVGGYSYNQTNFLDVGTCVYDWFGRCIRQRQQPGEIENKPHDQVIYDKSTFVRANLGWKINPDHTLRLSLAPTYTTRGGDERRPLDPTGRDPLSGHRSLFTFVTGLEETSEHFDSRLENIAFVKDYLQLARAQEVQGGSGKLLDRDRDTHQFGIGDSLRYRFLEWLYGKVSYEWATRLPSTIETFGDGVLVAENLNLQPETSHNGNLGLTFDVRKTGVGDFRLDSNGFIRSADNLIVLLGSDRLFSYQNVFSARALGIETSGGWTSPGEYLVLDGNMTYLDFRNTENKGTFGAFEGDRIPNRPYLFANGSARLQFRRVAAARDELSLVWNTRYVHEFYRGWESVGASSFKQVVPAQLLHSLGLTYLTRGDLVTLAFTGEAQNLTNQQAFDFFGVQRPGRAFYFKTTLEF